MYSSVKRCCFQHHTMRSAWLPVFQTRLSRLNPCALISWDKMGKDNNHKVQGYCWPILSTDSHLWCDTYTRHCGHPQGINSGLASTARHFTHFTLYFTPFTLLFTLLFLLYSLLYSFYFTPFTLLFTLLLLLFSLLYSFCFICYHFTAFTWCKEVTAISSGHLSVF